MDLFQLKCFVNVVDQRSFTKAAFEVSSSQSALSKQISKLEDELISLWQRTGTTVLFITHNIEEAVYMGQRIMVLTNKPTKIKAEIPVDLPRPRNLIDPKFVELRKQVTELIRWW